MTKQLDHAKLAASGRAKPAEDQVRGNGNSDIHLRSLMSTHMAVGDLMEFAPDGLIMTDTNGRIALVNCQGERMFGYQREELIGQPVEVLLPERFRSTHVGHRIAYQRAPRTRPMGIGMELAGRRRDGTEFPVDISLSPVSLGSSQFVMSIVRDVSERKRLEHEKEELLASVTHVLQGVSDAIVAMDTSGHITRVNPAACELFGAPEEELVGKHARDVFCWQDESGRFLDEDEYAFRKTLDTSSLVTATDRYLTRTDGTRVPTSVSSALVMDRERGVEMIVQVIRDISREREIEDLKNQIISLVSHELRTPIGHIKGFSSSLLDPEVHWDSETQLDFITEIDREADRLSVLVRDLLDMSRIESGTAVGERIEVSPAAVTQQALKDVENATTQHQVVDLVDEELPAVLGDAGQLERVVGNLVENAAKYSPADTTIRVDASVEDGALQWSVSDQGPGVPAEYRQRIFEKFVRVRSGAARIPGTGLGLPICRGIVEAHGGRLWLESPPEGGSRFCFTVPLAATTPQPVGP